MGNQVRVKNVSFSYDDDVLFRDLSLHFSSGSIYRIMGSNGVGKTTLLKLLAFELLQNEGVIDTDLTREEIVYLHDGNILDPNLSAKEHVDFLISFDKINRQRLAKLPYLLEKMKLGAYYNELTSALSLGTVMKLTFLLFWLQEPKMLMLDEFFSGIDTSGMRCIVDLINEMATEGTIILFVTHVDQNADLLAYRSVQICK
ncbi:ATP-binding cassette domain-containing protein [Lacticaseibacillus casei]|uniref:ATP-binding cassette domain-containing protein n=1 Tax=Lacticaseibacillus casei TaxID=1582 RepID=UPI00237EAA60|nr:ATP-binding cassette domain-containing protein [Lacticaseibacillus casei]MDE3283277.1 ATP-binding cassette domain-containing protein [Lacticaseibacillus casei]